jgi:hypothetical protein
VIIYPHPIAAFTAPSVCSGSPTVFTNNSIGNGGTIINWNWDFGNGFTSNLQNPTALFIDVGCYTVSLTVCNVLDCNTTSSIFCVNYWPDMLFFSEVPPAAEATSRSKRFELTLYSTTTVDHVIELYAQYSRSAPYQTPQNKWSHIVPQWNFEDADGNMIESVGTSDDYIYYNGHIIGTSGTAAGSVGAVSNRLPCRGSNFSLLAPYSLRSSRSRRCCNCPMRPSFFASSTSRSAISCLSNCGSSGSRLKSGVREASVLMPLETHDGSERFRS